MKIPRANVPTSDFVLDFSALDSARLGDGLTVNAIRSGGLKHTKDALIAATAESEGAVLVTEDKRLFRRSIEEQINVWSYTSFRQWLTESK